MGIKLKNNAVSTIPLALSSTATSLTVASGQGARFPILGTGDYFYATISNTGNNFEIVKVTARFDDTMTVTRGQEGTLALPFAANSRIELRVTVGNVEGGTYTPDGASAVARTLQAKLRETVSVKDFGATGDGVTPDDAAFVNAIAYAISVRAAVYVPGGQTYRLNNPLVIPTRVRIYGDGKELTRIESHSAGDVIRVTDGAFGGLSGMTIDCLSNSASVVGLHLIATLANPQQPQVYEFDDLRFRALSPSVGQIGLYIDASALGASQATFNKFSRIIIQGFDQPQKEVGGNEQNVFIDIQIIGAGAASGTYDCVYSESNASQYLAYQFQKGSGLATTIYGFHFASVPWGTQLNVAQGVADIGIGALIKDEGENNTITGQAFSPTTKGATTSNGYVNPLGSQRDASLYEVNAFALTGQNRNVFQTGVSGFSNGFSVTYKQSSPSQQMRYEFIDGPVGLCRTLPANAQFALPYIPVTASASLPAASANLSGAIAIEDTGSGYNLIYYAGTSRFRVTGVSF